MTQIKQKMADENMCHESCVVQYLCVYNTIPGAVRPDTRRLVRCRALHEGASDRISAIKSDSTKPSADVAVLTVDDTGRVFS